MGTSLSGLTPATTFDGLLKVGDNDPLTADLKAISTGDGTDTILQLSNSALQIDGGVTINNSSALAEMTITDNGVTLGSAGNGGILQLARSSGGVIYGKISTDNSQLKIQGANNINNILVSPNTSNGITITNDTTPLGAKLGVKGFGTTSATTSLLVQNSAGSELFKVQDDNKIYLGGGTTHYLQNGYNWFGSYWFLNTQIFRGALQNDLGSVKISDDLNVGGNTDNDTGVRLQVKGSGNDATTTALLVQNSDGNDLLKLTDDGALQINSDATQRFTIANASGSAALNFRYNNIYTSGGNVLYISGSQTIISGGGSERLRTSSTGTTIKGTGTTSATTALLVQDSAGTDLFKVQDNGQSQFYGIVNFRDDQQLMMQVNPSAGIIDFNPQNLTYDTRFRGDTTSNLIYVDASADKVGMNTNTPTAQLHLKGSGNDATTTALLVENSAGADILKVNDAGQISTSGSMTAGYFSAGTSILGAAYTRVRTTKLYPSQSGSGINVQADATSTAPDASAILQADSTTQGFLPPRMTSGEKNAITSPAPGLMVYDTDANQMSYWNGGGWINF